MPGVPQGRRAPNAFIKVAGRSTLPAWTFAERRFYFACDVHTTASLRT